MVVIDQFYQITEKRTRNVSFFWKVSHLIIFIVCAICGFLTSFGFGQILEDFNYFCPLNAKIVFSNTTYLNVTFHGRTVSVHAIDTILTSWGPISDCQFSQFTPLFTMISAIIWGAFFVILARGGAGYESDLLMRPWAIVYPCIFFTVIMFIIYAISILKLLRGLDAFIKQFSPQFGSDDCVKEIDAYTSQFHDSLETKNWFDFATNNDLTMYSSQIGIWAWALQLCLLIVRIIQMVDFDLHLVILLPKEEEIIEKITNPQDDETSLV